MVYGVLYTVYGILVPAVVFELEELEKFGVLLALLRRDVLAVPIQQIQHLAERLLILCQTTSVSTAHACRIVLLTVPSSSSLLLSA